MNDAATVGRAVQNCKVPREELFITTKLWISDTSYGGARKAFQTSMDKLGLVAFNEVAPAVDQVESWAPFAEGRGKLFENPVLKGIGENMGKVWHR